MKRKRIYKLKTCGRKKAITNISTDKSSHGRLIKRRKQVPKLNTPIEAQEDVPVKKPIKRLHVKRKRR